MNSGISFKSEPARHWRSFLIIMAGIACATPLCQASSRRSELRQPGFVWCFEGSGSMVESYKHSYAVSGEKCDYCITDTCYLFGVPFQCQECYNCRSYSGIATNVGREAVIGLTLGWGFGRRNMVGVEGLLTHAMVQYRQASPNSQVFGVTWWHYFSEKKTSWFTQSGLGLVTGGFGETRWTGMSAHAGIGLQFSRRIQGFVDYMGVVLHSHTPVQISGDRMLRIGIRWVGDLSIFE